MKLFSLHSFSLFTFLLLFLHSPTLHSSNTLMLAQYIAELTQKISPSPEALAYQETLQELLRLKAESDGCSAEAVKVYDDILETFKAVFPQLRQFLPADKRDFPLNPFSVYELVRSIERIKRLRERNHDFSPDKKIYSLQFNGGHPNFDIEVYFDENNQVYINFHGSSLALGSNKEYFKIYQFPTWKPVALGKVQSKSNGYQVDGTTENFRLLSHRLEAEVLGKIMQMPEQERAHLIATYSIGPDYLIQELLETDVIDVVDKGILKPEEMTNEVIMDIVGQAAEGMHFMHKHHLYNSDLKWENILLKIAREKNQSRQSHQGHQSKKTKKPTKTQRPLNTLNSLTVKITDFGMSFDVNEFANDQSKLIGYTKEYAPPELRGWSGDTPQEKMDLALRRDVFSFSVMVAERLRPHLTPWITQGACDEILQQTQRIRDKAKIEKEDQVELKRLGDLYLECKNEKLEQVLRDHPFESEQVQSDELTQILLRGMNPNPRERLTSAEWLKAYNIHQKKKKFPKPIHHYKRADFERQMKGILRFELNTDATKAQKKLQRRGQGEYLLIPHFGSSSSYSYLKLYYVTADGSVKSKDLMVDIRYPERVKMEIIFLKLVKLIR